MLIAMLYVNHYVYYHYVTHNFLKLFDSLTLIIDLITIGKNFFQTYITAIWTLIITIL